MFNVDQLAARPTKTEVEEMFKQLLEESKRNEPPDDGAAAEQNAKLLGKVGDFFWEFISNNVSQ